MAHPPPNRKEAHKAASAGVCFWFPLSLRVRWWGSRHAPGMYQWQSKQCRATWWTESVERNSDFWITWSGTFSINAVVSTTRQWNLFSAIEIAKIIDLRSFGWFQLIPTCLLYSICVNNISVNWWAALSKQSGCVRLLTTLNVPIFCWLQIFELLSTVVRTCKWKLASNHFCGPE